MTREEATEFIAQSVKSDVDMALVADAIKALEQEPTTKNDLGVDLISRADVLKLMKDNWHTHDGNWAMQESMDDIRALPSVTPQEPKTGHWIFVGEENEEETKAGNFRYVCSECGFSDVHGKSIYVPYCWQCGAKMAEPGESEEV